jgi:sodium/proline symporter
MEKTTVVIATLLAYKLLLIGVGFWAKSRNRDAEDFFLGGRGLGPVVAAISYSSSASSAWTLLGVSGIAYVIGISAVWIAAGSFSGMLVAWFWIGPRLMRFSRRHRQITVTDFLAHDSAGAMRRAIVIVTSAIVIFSFTFYVAAQFQGAGNTFASTFDLSMNEAILIGALIIMIYTMLGGFWAVSVTDTIQGLLMAVTAILMPIVAVAGAGGFGGFLDGLRAVSTPGQLSWNGGSAGLVAAGFIVGALSIGFGTYGQPHLLVRFMALRDEQALRRARVITIVWYAVVFLSMLFLGLVGHVLHQGVGNPETIFFVLTESLFGPFLGAVLLAAVLSAIMSTADSQLLVAASAIDHDLGLGRGRPERSLLISRLTIAFLVLFAVVVAIWLPERIFSRVLFAWIALGSAFGPTVFLRLGGVRLRPGGVLLSIVTGFGLAVLFYLMPDTPGDVLERLVPFCAALAALVLFGHRGPAQPGARRSSAPDTGT